MEKLTATIITCNEEAHIAEALKSVSFADETIVVDSGSTDKTVEIAEGIASKVIHNDWPGHVAQKNFAVDQATHDWVLSIDADERISPELAEKIKEALCSPNAGGFRLRRKAKYLGRWINHCGWYPDYRVRLFRKDKGRWGGVDPHDCVEVTGKVKTLDADILHYSYDDIADHIGTINAFTSISASRYHEKGLYCHWWDMVLRPPLSFLQKYFLKKGYLDGQAGLIICLLHGYYVLLKYAKLWELARRKDA